MNFHEISGTRNIVLNFEGDPCLWSYVLGACVHFPGRSHYGWDYGMQRWHLNVKTSGPQGPIFHMIDSDIWFFFFNRLIIKILSASTGVWSFECFPATSVNKAEIMTSFCLSFCKQDNWQMRKSTSTKLGRHRHGQGPKGNLK